MEQFHFRPNVPLENVFNILFKKRSWEKSFRVLRMASIGRLLARYGPMIVRNQWTCFAALDTRSTLFFRDYCVIFGELKEAGEKTSFLPASFD